MKSLKISVVLILVLAFLAGMTACGKNNAASADQKTDIQQTTEQADTPEEVTVEQTIPTADSNAGVDGLVGSWKDINSAENFVIITKTDTGYQYEDNDGKYPATFENGVLKVKASDIDTADVYIDTKTGHMLTAYQGGLSEYERK